VEIPDWVPIEERANPIASHYMYFAHHEGKYIRMAWTDDVASDNWRLFNVGQGTEPLGECSLGPNPGGGGEMINCEFTVCPTVSHSLTHPYYVRLEIGGGGGDRGGYGQAKFFTVVFGILSEEGLLDVVFLPFLPPQ
jgi:hypothetical protein